VFHLFLLLMSLLLFCWT